MYHLRLFLGFCSGCLMRALLRNFLIFLSFVCFGDAVFAQAQVPAQDVRPIVRIGLVDTFSPDFYINTYAATIQYLKRRFPQYRFESIEFNNDESFTEEDARGLDFLVSSAGTFGIRAQAFGAEQVVMRKRSDVKNASQSVAAVFVARADNGRINTLEDMRHAKAAATNPSSFDGWLIAQDEIAREGFDPEDFFASVQFTQYNFPDVISRVLVGQADVGILVRCQLERWLESGLVDSQAIKVIHAQEGADEPCRRSSEMYPAEVIAVFPHTDAALAKSVTIALLQMPVSAQADVGWEWVTVNDMVNISSLMERLSLGSFAYQREFTIEALARRYWREIILMLALAAAAIFHILRVDRLVMLRTRELVQTINEKETLLERMKRTQQYLQLLERNTIVSQLSSLFAHEMKQPVTNIINYVAGIAMLRKTGRDTAPVVDQALQAIDDQAHRMAQIVDRVRAYAKHESLAKSDCLLSEIVSTMIENFRLAQKSVSSIVVQVPTSIHVLAEPVSLELLLLNLVRNAERAASSSSQPRVYISAGTDERGVWVSVSDNGPPVSEDLFERLGRIGGVKSSQGLGMGLAIAKGIAENHNGHLEFFRSKDGGLEVILVMPAFVSESGAEHG